jgi:hypothetical protein
MSVDAKLDFLVGDKVRIKPCDKIDARVVCIYWDWRGLTYDVRYFENGDAKVARLFPDEIEHMDGKP